MEYPDLFAVLDFEANCSGRNKTDHTAIEVPVILLDAYTGETVATFHKYVKPTSIPKISDFIHELTGITQEQVDASNPLPVVLAELDTWLSQYHDKKIVFVTCGDWDLKTLLPQDCLLYRIPVPERMRSWINIKKVFAERVYKNKKGSMLGMAGMLHYCGMEIEGRHHSGIDDVKNICRVIKWMIERGRLRTIEDLYIGYGEIKPHQTIW